MNLIYPGIYDSLLSYFGPQGWWPGETKEEIIIGAILTQNTAWSNVIRALENLKRHGDITLNFIHNSDPMLLIELIKPAGYYNQKSKTLKNFTGHLYNHYEGDLNLLFNNNTAVLREELLSIKGIGPETADDILLYAAERCVFVIDSYTRRFLSRHKFYDENAQYEKLRRFMEDKVVSDIQIYKEYHALIVKLAKEFCSKRNPECSICPVYKIHKPVIDEKY